MSRYAPLQFMPEVATVASRSRSGVPAQNVVRRKSASRSARSTARLGVSQSISESIEALQQTGGAPLPESVQKDFEERLGQDFSQVRVHTGERPATTARQLKAKAFTVGNDVVFGKGQFAPNTTAGKRLIAHELTHVGQQRKGDHNRVQRQPIDSQPANIPCEPQRETDEDHPSSTTPPLVYMVAAPQWLAKKRAERPAVGYAQQLLNRFLVAFSANQVGCATGINQDRLKYWKSRIKGDALSVDCQFGSRTDAAAHMFQLCSGLYEDGKLGPQTWGMLESLYGTPGSYVPPAPPQPAQPGLVVTPCTGLPKLLYSEAGCGAGSDFTFHDYPPLALTKSQWALVAPFRLLSNGALETQMGVELGTLAGSEGLRMRDHFATGGGATLSHGAASVLGALALGAGSITNFSSKLKSHLVLQLLAMELTGTINCNALSMSFTSSVRPHFGFSDGTTLKAIIGGTQGLEVYLQGFSLDPVTKAYRIELRYVICDDFGVDTSDLYSPSLIAFWMLQHERRGTHRPFINQLDLPLVLNGKL